MSLADNNLPEDSVRRERAPGVIRVLRGLAAFRLGAGVGNAAEPKLCDSWHHQWRGVSLSTGKMSRRRERALEHLPSRGRRGGCLGDPAKRSENMSD
jgi:hypothetical protein